MSHESNDPEKFDATQEFTAHFYQNAHADAIFLHLPGAFLTALDDLFGEASDAKALLVSFLFLLEKSLNAEEKAKLHSQLENIGAEYKELPSAFMKYIDTVYGKSAGKGLFVLHVLQLAGQLTPENRSKLYDTYLNEHSQAPLLLDEFQLLRQFNDSLRCDPNLSPLFRS